MEAQILDIRSAICWGVLLSDAALDAIIFAQKVAALNGSSGGCLLKRHASDL
jgi:hypothetical protein